MAHGSGGRLMRQLIDQVFIEAFDNPELRQRHDGAILESAPGKIAFTTDSYVVYPLFFPGSDIGKLAVYGTINDLAMCGARPLYLSAGFIIEEGFALEDLWRIVRSMQSAADRIGACIVTGDTKIVERGKGDGVYINTAGVGIIEHSLAIKPTSVREGDKIILSGDIGRHGIAVMAAREDLGFDTTIASDCAPLWGAVAKLLDAKIPLHCLRDLTRGGLAAALVEIANDGRQRIVIEETTIPVTEDVRAICEILGLDPIHVANEGRFIAILPSEHTDHALQLIRSANPEVAPAIIGEVISGDAGVVTIKGLYGVERVLDLPSGEQLPRIC
jgi:hydrogenase expression/formation protein HypE